MAEKQMSGMEERSKTDADDALEMKIKQLKDLNDVELKNLLGKHGMDKMPISKHTKNPLIKKLAKKMLDLAPESYSECQEPDLQEPVKTKSCMSVVDKVKDVTKSESNNNTDTKGLRKNLVEVKESLIACVGVSNRTHYVVCIPGTENTVSVHRDFHEVLKLMKENKSQNPRMLSFHNLADAEAFAKDHSANEVCEGATIKTNYPQEKAEVETGEVKLFPSLSPPQINEFRIQLERGSLGFCRERILANPKFLIGNGDMPTILKEGTRYNAMHSSVISNQLDCCKMVMEMVSDVEFLKRMYGTQAKAEENSKRLIDLYLNTPDKIAHKTPLHFASEKGMVDIVAFLVSFKACIRNFNRHIVVTVKEGNKQVEKNTCTGRTPEEVACSRYQGSDVASVKAKIISLIQDGTCYVPLIRSDTTGPYAKVGNPYSPSSPYKIVSEIEDVFKPVTSPNLDLKDFKNMKVWAYAGPMSPQEAQDFKREWKSPHVKRSDRNIKDNLKILDGERGFERFGRELADIHYTSWQEYWPFLDAFADLRSEDGLEKLELFFQKQQVLIMMQALLNNESLSPSAAYDVSKDFILKHETDPKSEESGPENETYFSADSLSSSDDDTDDKKDVTEDSCEVATKTNIVSKSGGVMTSFWNGLSRLKNYLSPNSHRSSPSRDMPSASGLEPEKVRPRTRKDSSQEGKKRRSLDDTNNSLVPDSEDTGKENSEETYSDSLEPEDSNSLHSNHGTQDVNKESKEEGEISIPEKRFEETSSSKEYNISPDNNEESSQSCSTSSIVSQTTEREVSPSKLDTLKEVNPDLSHKEDSKQDTIDIVSTEQSASSLSSDTDSTPVVPSKKVIDVCNAKDQWTYRKSNESIGSPCKSPVSDGETSLSSDEMKSPDTSSWRYLDSQTVTTDTLNQEKQQLHNSNASETPSSSTLKPCTILNDSFNTKLTKICSGLEDFSITSPQQSSTNTTLNFSAIDDFETVLEPSIHIFAGKMFRKFSIELENKRPTDNKAGHFRNKSTVPIIFLRQSNDGETVLADFFLPVAENIQDILLGIKGPVMDEQTHRECIKNVWVNFLTVFPVSSEAKKFCQLEKEEVVKVVVEGVPEDKETFCLSSSRSRELDYANLKQLFLKSKEDFEKTDSCELNARIVRASCLPYKDVYVCGCIPTKVDADVYHTLSQTTHQFISDHANKFPLVYCWLQHMDQRGKDFVNSLPSPSRILRSGRRERPPVSPLVKSESRTDSKASDQSDMFSSPKTSRHVRQDGPIIRNLFGSGGKENND